MKDIRNYFCSGLLFLIFSCQSSEVRVSKKEEKARALGHPVFLHIQKRIQKSPKVVSLRLTVKNLSLEHRIRSLKILLFALDKNGQIIVAEHQKTPELLCIIKRPITIDKRDICLIGPVAYASEPNQLQLHSISLTLEDGLRHVIDQEDLEEITEWH